MRAAACAVLFFERGHVARTHRAGVLLAAFAHADAAKRRPRERSAIVDELEMGRGLERPVVGPQPEILRREVRIDDLVRVHLVARIPHGLEFTERGHQFGTEHLRQQRAA